MGMETLVLAALKEKAPVLHRQLAAAGSLATFARERADAINEAISMQVDLARQEKKLDRLPPMDRARALAAEDALARETVLDQMLEFPPDTNWGCK